MPSLRTRVRHDRAVLASAEAALATAQAELAAASTAVSEATGNLEALALGNLDLQAITIDGVRFIVEDGVLVPEA